MVFIWSHRKYNTSTGCILLVSVQGKLGSLNSIHKFMFHLVLIYVAFFLFYIFLLLWVIFTIIAVLINSSAVVYFVLFLFSLVRTLKVFLYCTIFSIKVEHYKWILYYKVGHKQSIRLMTNPTVIVCCLMSCFYFNKTRSYNASYILKVHEYKIKPLKFQKIKCIIMFLASENSVSIDHPTKICLFLLELYYFFVLLIKREIKEICVMEIK